MKRTKKISKLVVPFALALCIFPLSASAETYIGTTYSGSFASDWSKTLVCTDGHSKLEYGFNTWLVNEDTAYAYHDNSSHYAKIINGFGTHTAGSKIAGEWSNLEVQHAGSSVEYRCAW